MKYEELSFVEQIDFTIPNSYFIIKESFIIPN